MYGFKTEVTISKRAPYSSLKTNLLFACTIQIASIVHQINYDVHLSRLFYCRGVSTFKAGT